jgi:hypothetical protein
MSTAWSNKRKTRQTPQRSDAETERELKERREELREYGRDERAWEGKGIRRGAKINISVQGVACAQISREKMFCKLHGNYNQSQG